MKSILVTTIFLLICVDVFADFSYFFVNVKVELKNGEFRKGYIFDHGYYISNNDSTNTSDFTKYIFGKNASDTIFIHYYVNSYGDLQYFSDEHYRIPKSSIKSIKPVKFIRFIAGNNAILSKLEIADTTWLKKDFLEEKYLFTEDLNSFSIYNFSSDSISNKLIDEISEIIKSIPNVNYFELRRIENINYLELRKKQMVLFRMAEI